MIKKDTLDLTLEQKFQLQCLQQEYQDLDHDQIIHSLLETMQQIMIRDNTIRNL